MPNGTYTPQDYLLGKCRVPPDVAVCPMKTYVYGGDISIANNTSAILSIALDADSHFLVEGIEILTSLQTTAGESATIQISDTTYSQPWSNILVPMRDVAGYGGIPHELKYPNILAPTATLNVNINNAGGATQQFYVAFHGHKIYNVTDAQRAFMMRRMNYFYGMSVPQMLAGVTGTTASVQLYNESDFLLYRMWSFQMWAQIMAATIGTVSAEVTCNFRDTSSDRNFFSKLLALRLVTGAGTAPLVNGGTNVVWGDTHFRFIPAMFIRRNGLIEGTFNNNANSTISASIITMEGARVWS